MIEVSLFKTKNESQLTERITAIKGICQKWLITSMGAPESEVHKDFNEIFSMCRNIELSDLPLRYDPASQNWEHIDRMEREVAPMVGDTIVLDCGDTVEVLHVSHQWDGDSANLVQVMTREVEQQ